MTDTTLSPTPSLPLFPIDPTHTDHHAPHATAIREADPVVHTVLPGGVRAWVLTDHALLADLSTDPRVSRDWRHWEDLQRGEVPHDSPLLGVIRVNNLTTRDGDEHRRLRRPLARTFTRTKVEQMAPRIDQIVTSLLDDLPHHADRDGFVDLHTFYAQPIPIHVMSELIGIPEAWRPRLRTLIDATPPQRRELFTNLIAMRRAEPADDLISSLLVAAPDQEEAPYTDEELEDTLWTLIDASHEASSSLIRNATRALLAAGRPGGTTSWHEVIEETLRHDTPTGHYPARFPTQDITIAGVTIPKGDLILAPRTTVTGNHATQQHSAFGSGPHACIAPALARMEANAALPALFARYPQLQLSPQPFNHTTPSLPVRLGPTSL